MGNPPDSSFGVKFHPDRPINKAKGDKMFTIRAYWTDGPGFYFYFSGRNGWIQGPDESKAQKFDTKAEAQKMIHRVHPRNATNKQYEIYPVSS